VENLKREVPGIDPPVPWDIIMNLKPVNNSTRKSALPRVLPLAGLAITLVAGFFILFGSGYGGAQVASAQVNFPKIGEQVAGQVSESAGKSSVSQAPDQAAPPPTALAGETAPGEMSAGMTESEVSTLEGIPGESATSSGAGDQVVYDTSPGSAWYVNGEGVGSVKLTDLTTDQLLSEIQKIPEYAAAPDKAKATLLQTLMPILERFQVMVSPPIKLTELKPGEKPPWEAGNLRRYSPFDVVGGGGPPPGKTTPIPPFPPLTQQNKPKNLVSASQLAAGLKLVGVLGEPGSYQAILTGAGMEKRLRVGDELTKVGEESFIISDITMSSVRISNKERPADQALVQFVSRSGIADVSISY
jgi:hypothetical protein